MNVDDFFFRLYVRPLDGGDLRFAGSCFPITERGDLLTCRHNADVDRARYDLLVHDNVTGEKRAVKRVACSDRADLAILLHALPEGRPYLPVLTPKRLKVGASVFSYGFWQPKGTGRVEQGYFSGDIVSFEKSEDQPPVWTLTLPFPSVEGMSGAPVLTSYKGEKVVGVLYSNRSTRVVAQEVTEVTETGEHFEETVYRVVEFGLAYHASEIVQTLLTFTSMGSWIVTEETTKLPGSET